MTLKELKALLDAAIAALEADPENAELKTKVEEAQAAYDAKVAEEGGEGNEEDPDESALDAKTKAYLAKLRKENAKYRVEAKDSKSKLKAEEEKRKAILKAAGIELEEEEPAEKLKKVSETNNNLQFRNAILETAVAHGVGSESLKYFQFLMSEAVEELGEDEELTDEKIAELVSEAKTKGGGKGKANTSVGNGGKGGKEPPKPGASDKITLEKFTRMTMTEKSDLYTKNRALYEELANEARKKKVLV